MASLASRQYDWTEWQIQELFIETWQINVKTPPMVLRQRSTSLLGIIKNDSETQWKWKRLAPRASPSLQIEKLLYSPVYKGSSFGKKWELMSREIAYFAKDKILEEAQLVLDKQTLLEDCMARLTLLRKKAKNSSGGFSDLYSCLRIKVISNNQIVFSGHPIEFHQYFCL
ncbi:MAG: hypothetical protein KA116_01355 [Proteobacteria bacterium]|nr:hypothetical protein [Pseudomonadota bacterium]